MGGWGCGSWLVGCIRTPKKHNFLTCLSKFYMKSIVFLCKIKMVSTLRIIKNYGRRIISKQRKTDLGTPTGGFLEKVLLGKNNC